MIHDLGTFIKVRDCGMIDVTSMAVDAKPRRFSSSDLDEVILIVTEIVEEKKRLFCTKGKSRKEK